MTYWIWNSPTGTRQIYYREGGKGANHLLFLHGYGSHTCTWNDLFEPYEKAGYKVWALDLLGFGFSDKPLDIKYSIELYLEQLLAFMDDKHIDEVHIIAHSMGGTVALCMALSHLKKVKSLTLISPMAYPFQLPFGFRFAKRFPSLVKPFCGLAFVRAMRKQFVVNRESSCTPEKVKEAAEPYLLPNGAAAAFKILREFDNRFLAEMSQRYKEIALPTQIIWGKEDSLIPVGHSLFFKRDIPHAEIHIFEECGHIPHEEYPLKLESASSNFLNRLNSQ